MNKTIYLCGPIAGRSDAEAKNWRELAKKLWAPHGACFDPMDRDYREKYPSLEGDWDACRAMSAEIVMQDKEDIRRADAVLVYYATPSVGTSMEILYAHTLIHKPVVLVNASMQPVISPWLIHHVDAVVPDLVGAVGALSKILYKEGRHV